MLNKEILSSNEVLKTLSDEQFATISELSKNDETSILSTKLTNLESEYSLKFKDALGLEPQQGEETKTFIERSLSDLGGQKKAFKESESKFLLEIETLKKATEGKGNEVTEGLLRDANDKLIQTEQLLTIAKEDIATEKSNNVKALKGYRLNSEFSNVENSLSFKKAFSKDVQSVLIRSAKNNILANFKSDYVKNEKGEEILVFRDANGTLVLNSENSLKPFSASELLKKELGDVLENGSQQGGTGTGGNGNNGNGAIIDISEAKTQIQADDLIRRHLEAGGFKKGSKDFMKEQVKVRRDNKVSSLPFR